MVERGIPLQGPDLHGTVYSLYNSACQIITLDTFKQAVISHAYASTKPNLKYVNDMALLIKIYDHIVHQYFYLHWHWDIQHLLGNRFPIPVQLYGELSIFGLTIILYIVCLYYSLFPTHAHCSCTLLTHIALISSLYL